MWIVNSPKNGNKYLREQASLIAKLGKIMNDTTAMPKEATIRNNDEFEMNTNRN